MRASAGAGSCFLGQWVTCGGGVGGVLAARCGWTDPAFGRGRRPLSLAWANGHPWGCPPLADGAASARGPRPKDGSGRPCQTSATGSGVRVLSVRRGCSVAGRGEGRPRWAGPRSGGRCKGGVGGAGVGTKSPSALVAWLRWAGRQPPIAANLPTRMRNRRSAAKQGRNRTTSLPLACGFTLGSSSSLRGIATPVGTDGRVVSRKVLIVPARDRNRESWSATVGSFRVLIVPARDRNTQARMTARARSRSSSSLRGIATAADDLGDAGGLRRPHRPCEGSQQLECRPRWASELESSSSLRGIATSRCGRSRRCSP